jgi:dephospho-CoA kinase
MLSIGLTGNRMSGKNLVMNTFKQAGVPVFDADLVLKYLLNYRPDITMSVLGNMGDEYLVQGSYIDLSKIDDDSKFNDLLDLLDFQITEAYNKFRSRHKSQYTIFKCSWLFERDMCSRFDLIINVFAPKDVRVMRHRVEVGANLTESYNLFKNELTDIYKNNNSDYIIHSYDCGLCVLNQVNNIDMKIVDSLIKKTEKEIQHD